MQKQNLCQGDFMPKNRQHYRKIKYPDKVTKQNALYLSGYFCLVLWEVEMLISRQPLFNTRYKSVLLFYYLLDFTINHLIRSPRATQTPIFITIATISPNNCMYIRFLLIPHTKLSRSFYLILLYIL